MASRPVTYEEDFETETSQGVAASIARNLTAFAGARRAYGMWHDIRVLESQAYRHADAAARPWSLSAWLLRLVAAAARAIAAEVRIRRDMRELMAMNDQMLKDVGITRAEIGSAVRYGRN